MIPGIEQFCQTIAGSMVETIPEEWSSALFDAVFYPDGVLYEAEYTRMADGVTRAFLPSAAGQRAFRELRKRFKEAGKPRWCRARFELQPDGHCDMRWGYDGCDENGFVVVDEEEELRRREERFIRLSRLQ